MLVIYCALELSLQARVGEILKSCRRGLLLLLFSLVKFEACVRKQNGDLLQLSALQDGENVDVIPK